MQYTWHAYALLLVRVVSYSAGLRPTRKIRYVLYIIIIDWKLKHPGPSAGAGLGRNVNLLGLWAVWAVAFS